MSSPTNPKRLSVIIPNTPIRSREPSLEPRSRSNSVVRRNSIDNSAESFAANCEKLAERHKTDKVKVVIESLIKVLELIVKK